jgi:hypothetical protein
MTTLLHEQTTSVHPPDAIDAGGEALWLDADAIATATGWQWKPEGLCQGDVCLPLSPAARATLVRDEPGRAPRLDIAGFWRATGQPVVHDDARATWVLGTGAAQRQAALQTLEAPDFALPDLAGAVHRLSDFRGRKVLLATWASW